MLDKTHRLVNKMARRQLGIFRKIANTWLHMQIEGRPHGKTSRRQPVHCTAALEAIELQNRVIHGAVTAVEKHVRVGLDRVLSIAG